MPTTYDKLIRDRIPEIIRATGRDCGFEVMDEQAYHQALLTKLLEESKELAEATNEEKLKELADIREVLSALAHFYGLTEAQVEDMQTQRRTERGGFTKRLRLLWVD